MISSQPEVAAGDRFAFGDNWRAFIELVDETRIDTAVSSLTGPLGITDLSGRRFLDAGCGSGLFSLAAHRLGAQVTSFDFDAESVAATLELRRRFGQDDAAWSVAVGSVLDEQYVAELGRFDVVYSWGVLHHTGDMWRALERISCCVAPHGLLYISIYNDQGTESRIWRRIKRRYNRSGPLTRHALVGLSAGYLWRRQLLVRIGRAVRRRPGTAATTPPPRARGMSVKHDLYDWVGGYPFEVAKPEEVFGFLRDRGFGLRFLKTCAGGIGCNEYVFERTGTDRA